MVQRQIDEVIAVDGCQQRPLRRTRQHQGDGEEPGIDHQPALAMARPGCAIGKIAPTPGMAKAQHARSTRDHRVLQLSQQQPLPHIGGVGADVDFPLPIQRRQGADIGQLLLQGRHRHLQLLRLLGQVRVIFPQRLQVHL